MEFRRALQKTTCGTICGEIVQKIKSIFLKNNTLCCYADVIGFLRTIFFSRSEKTFHSLKFEVT